MRRITIASIQPPCLDEASTASHAHMVEKGFALLEEALTKDTAFCCLPEYFNVFGADSAAYCTLAQNHAALLDRTRALAAQHASHIILPMLVPDGDGFYNRAYLIDPQGHIKGHYNKIHPT